jgi:tripeptidyl-peptidase-1
VREHVDYITPGITLREVTGVGKRNGESIQKRFTNGLPPILEPIALPLELLLGQLAEFCDIAITPQCIRGKQPSVLSISTRADHPVEMYNITEGTSATKGNELGIFEGLGDVYAQEDLDLFFTTLAR